MRVQDPRPGAFSLPWLRWIEARLRDRAHENSSKAPEREPADRAREVCRLLGQARRRDLCVGMGVRVVCVVSLAN